MSAVKITRSKEAAKKFEEYPDHIRKLMSLLRSCIIEVASEIDHINRIEETLKWGEPSYKVKKGSPIRIDWKPKAPNQYAMYFNCNTTLVETFRNIYGNLFDYEKNRAIVFQVDHKIPEKELKVCISLALQYHLLKDQPLLGF